MFGDVGLGRGVPRLHRIDGHVESGELILEFLHLLGMLLQRASHPDRDVALVFLTLLSIGRKRESRRVLIQEVKMFLNIL